MKKSSKLLKAIFLWATYFLPIYSFEKVFAFLRINTTDFIGIYRDGIFTFSVLAIIPTVIFLLLSPKLFHKSVYKAVIILFYLGYYYLACTSIAWDYRIIFGTTWQWSEVFTELVKPEWYFYFFGVLGTFFNYYCQKSVQNKTIELD